MKSQVMGVGALVFLAFCSFAQTPKEQEDRPARLIESLKGPDLYRAYCAVCHGSDAKGNGPLAKWLRTAPADLTRIASRNGGSFPLARVQRVISGAESMKCRCGGRSFRRLTGIRIWDAFESTTWHGILRAFRRSSLAVRLSGSSSYLTQSALLAFIRIEPC